MDYSQFYNEEYYKTSCGEISYLETDKWLPFYEKVADKIIETLNPKTVLDVGCALGYLVAALRDRGVEAYGIDVSDFAISRVREDIKPYCRVCSALDDLPADFPRKYDLVVTIEVAEHLYEEDVDLFLDNITSYAENVLFSSTADDVMEKTHFNVQQPEYWAKRFAERGFFRELTYDASFITKYVFLFTKKKLEIKKLVEKYERSLNVLNRQISLDADKKKSQIEWLNKLIIEKDQYIKDLEEAENEKDKQIEQLSQALTQLQEDNAKLQEKNNEHEARIQELIQSSEWLHFEVEKWKSAYSAISQSTFWRLTKPARAALDIMKRVCKHLAHNKITLSISKFRMSVKTIGFKNTMTKVGSKLLGKSDIGAGIPYGLPDTDDKNVNYLINQKLRDIQPIQTVIVDHGPRRLNVVTDSIDDHSLLGGVATALIVATEFANRNNMNLRIITRTTPPNPVNYKKIMEFSGIKAPEIVMFYSDYDRDILGNTNFKLEISENDIFFATSWWSAMSIKGTSLRKRFFYIIQEVETFFYPHGDLHYLCTQIMHDKSIDFIINSHYLYEYFKDREPNIVNNGVYFEPAFPGSLYKPNEYTFRPKKKYKLFFYTRPNNPRNMFIYGVKLLEKCIESGILNTNEWDIYCAGQSTPTLKFSNGYVAHNLGLMKWDEYSKFLSDVDLALSLMYTPHPSYPPFDVACSGGVVISNYYENKKEFGMCKNVIFSSLEENEFLKSMSDAIRLAKDMSQRKKNFEESTIPRVWHDTLRPTMEFMEERLENV